MTRKWFGVGWILASALLAPIAASAQQTEKPLGSTGAPYGYLEYLPTGYASGGPWPLVIFLHGRGEKGNGTTDLDRVWKLGYPNKAQAGVQYPFVMISPQTSVEPWSVTNIDALIDFIKSNYDIDPDRVYVTGLSLGGIGTWNYARSHSAELAAIMPTCGAPGGTPGTAEGNAFVDLPTWAFHRWGDTLAPTGNTIRWVNAVAGALTGDPPTNVMANYPGDPNTATITRTASYSAATETWTWRDGIVQVAGSQPTFTLMPKGSGDSHNCWTDAYNSQTALNWLLAQSRNAGPQDLQLITPAGAGKASDSLYFPMQLAFDAQPTLNSSDDPVGGTGGADAPYYVSRTGYIDFGPEWYKIRIVETWTRYRVSSVGDQTPYAEVWWDDDIDSLNDNGFTSSLNFNTAQDLSTGSTEPWIRDKDFSLTVAIPRARYLLLRSPANMTNRAKEYAIIGYIDPNATP